MDPGHVDRIFYRVKRKFDLRNITTLQDEQPSKKFIGLSFNIFNQSLSEKLKRFDVANGISTRNNLCSKLPNLKDKVQLMDESGIYHVTCGDCGKIYLGQIRRSFGTRFEEHLKHPNKSTFCNHLIMNDHDPLQARLKVINVENKALKLNVLESVEINRLFRKLPHLIMNEQLGHCQGSVIKWLDKLH